MSICRHPIHNCVKIHAKPCKELRTNLMGLIQEGIPLVRALEVFLIDPSDFGRMRVLAEGGDEELMEFAHECLAAEVSFEITLVRTAIKNPNAAAKLLENRFSETWKNYEPSDIEKMSASELQRFIETQEKKQLLLDITKMAVTNED
jgi:hypothetical protein